MNTIGTYGMINAKVRTMRSYFLTEVLYRQLIEAKSLREFWNLLSETRYRSLVETASNLEPAQVEHAFLMEEVEQLRQIKKYSHKKTMNVLSRLMERYDGEKLKIILRAWFKRKTEADDIYLDPIFYDFPVKSLLAAKDINEFILLLVDTPFLKAMIPAIEPFNQTHSLFPLELAIDRQVYARLLDVKTFLNRRDRRIVERLIGVEIDLRNLDWIGRFKKYFEVSSAQIGDYLLPHGYRLGERQIRQFLGGDSVTMVLQDLLRGMRINLPADLKGDLALDALDLFLREVLMREAKRAFMGFPFSIGAILGYYYLMRLEMQNLRTLVQAKQYNILPQAVDSMILY